MGKYELWVNMNYVWVWIMVEYDLCVNMNHGWMWNMGGNTQTDKHTDTGTHTDTQTHQYHDSAWSRGRAKWKCSFIGDGLSPILQNFLITYIPCFKSIFIYFFYFFYYKWRQPVKGGSYFKLTLGRISWAESTVGQLACCFPPATAPGSLRERMLGL